VPHSLYIYIYIYILYIFHHVKGKTHVNAHRVGGKLTATRQTESRPKSETRKRSLKS
jgi:hypothetical protein